MNITKLNKPFVAQTILTAAQLNSVTDKIDTIIDNLPSTSSGNNENDNDISQDIIDAKNWITGKIQDIQALIAQFDQGNTHIRTDAEMLDLFKGEMGKALLVHYGICDANGHPYFNVLVDENGVKPAAIVASINNSSSQIGISANKITIDGNTTLTGKLSALDAVITHLKLTYGLDIETTGNSTQNGGEISISNSTGIQVGFLETTGIDGGYVYIGKPSASDNFGVYTSHTPNGGNTTSGVGYTGVINGARYVNGICVGAA